MKAIRMRMQKFSRPLVILLAVVVAIITSMVVANATQTITTPNAVKVTYSLAAGGNSAAITPAANTSVLVMGCCTTESSQGVGQVSLQHIPTVGPALGLIEWVGLESTAGATITEGFSSTARHHMVYIDFQHQVDIQVNSADTIKIHNGASSTRIGNVTLIW